MSPRAACRLETLGFTKVHDYAAGKVDWLAHALPVQGTRADRPTAGSLARDDAATCSLNDTVGEVLRRIDASPYGFALVLSTDRILLGRARRSALQSADPGASVEPLMEPGPSTIRSHLTADELRQRLARSEAKTLLVTTPRGSLLGVLRSEDVPT
jgi:Mg/Co/Ni transporter MgtE